MELEQAHKIAMQLYTHLEPHCTTINIAGSIRRQSAEVGDIELVCIPKQDPVIDLFGSITGYIRSNNWKQAVEVIGKHISGKTEHGRHLQYMVNGTGMQLDLFVPQPHDYYRMYAIRTGSADYSKRVLAGAWVRKGWCGTPDGLRLMEESERKVQGDKTVWSCKHPSPTLPPAWQNEQEFFTWLGVPFLNPKCRL